MPPFNLSTLLQPMQLAREFVDSNSERPQEEQGEQGERAENDCEHGPILYRSRRLVPHLSVIRGYE